MGGCSAVCAVIRQLAGMARVIEITLEERLAVPPVWYLHAYRVGARYMKHLDSNNLYGGFDDNPHKLTMNLFLSHKPEKPSTATMRYWPSAGGKIPRTTPRDINLLHGRIVIFWSREIWYEFDNDDQLRFVLTLYLHDR